LGEVKGRGGKGNGDFKQGLYMCKKERFHGRH
jgi:hypothetical protein